MAEAEAAASPVMARTASAPLQGRKGKSSRARGENGEISCLNFYFPTEKNETKFIFIYNMKFITQIYSNMKEKISFWGIIWKGYSVYFAQEET